LYKNDIRFFRLLALAGFFHEELGIRYREDQKNIRSIEYKDPGDLFLHGLMDTRQGTCGTMAALWVAVCWRLGWPVYLGVVRTHFICRFEADDVAWNLETTAVDMGGLCVHPDEHYHEVDGLSKKAVACGSDRRSLTPYETLAAFISLRARFWDDNYRFDLSYIDYAMAAAFYPHSRMINTGLVEASIRRSGWLFDPQEHGSPKSLAAWLNQGHHEIVCPQSQTKPPNPSDQEYPREQVVYVGF